MTWVEAWTGSLLSATIALPNGDMREVLRDAWSWRDAILLGHAWDGVIWGRIHGGNIEIARDRGKPGAELRRETLTDLSIFDAARELRVWRVDDALRACVLFEGPAGEGIECAARGDRVYLLIQRPEVVLEPDDFVELVGLAGQRHAPPGRPVPRGLRVRHYFAREDNALLRECAHRCVALEPREAAA